MVRICRHRRFTGDGRCLLTEPVRRVWDHGQIQGTNQASLMNKLLWRQSVWGNIINVALTALMTAATNEFTRQRRQRQLLIGYRRCLWYMDPPGAHARCQIFIAGTGDVLLRSPVYSPGSQWVKCVCLWIIGVTLLSLYCGNGHGSA